MGKKFLDQLGMVTAREEQRGAGVPEIVEADVRQPGPLEKWLKRSPGYVVGVQGLPPWVQKISP